MLRKGQTVKIQLRSPNRSKIFGVVISTTDRELCVITNQNKKEILPWYTIQYLEVTSDGLRNFL